MATKTPARARRRPHAEERHGDPDRIAPGAGELAVAARQRSDDDILTTEDFAREYRIPAGTVRYLRSRGQGPAYMRLGGGGPQGRVVRYRRAAIEAWLRTRTTEPAASSETRSAS